MKNTRFFDSAISVSEQINTHKTSEAGCVDPTTILPIEILYKIFEYLDLQDLYRLSGVNENWDRLSNAPRIINPKILFQIRNISAC